MMNAADPRAVLAAIQARANEFARWMREPGEWSISEDEAQAWADRVPALVAALGAVLDLADDCASAQVHPDWGGSALAATVPVHALRAVIAEHLGGAT